LKGTWVNSKFAARASIMPAKCGIEPAPDVTTARSDRQLDIVFRLAAPLLDVDRSAFLEEVARVLGGLPEVGDGVARTCVQVRRRIGSRAAGSSKWR
jgi:hypothetical protein